MNIDPCRYLTTSNITNCREYAFFYRSVFRTSRDITDLGFFMKIGLFFFSFTTIASRFLFV